MRKNLSCCEAIKYKYLNSAFFLFFCIKYKLRCSWHFSSRSFRTQFNSRKIRCKGFCNGPLRERTLWESEKIKPKVITIKAWGLNQEHMTLSKCWERNANTGISYLTGKLNALATHEHWPHFWEHCEVFVEMLKKRKKNQIWSKMFSKVSSRITVSA